jgi:MFS family permease
LFKLRPHPWVTFSALSLLFFVVSAGTFSSMGVVLRPMVHELGWNWKQAGMGYTLLGVGCGLASFIPAALIRRIGVSATLLIGTVLLASGFGMLAVTHAVWTYLAATTLIGVAFAVCATVPGTHVLTSLFKRRSTVLGAYFTIGALGGVAGPLIYIAAQALTQGWRAYWIVFVMLAVASGLFAAATTTGRFDLEPSDIIPPEQVDPVELIEGLHDWTVRRALMTWQFYVIVAGYTMYLLINTTAHGFAVEHLTERGVDPNVAAGMLSVEALIGAGVSLIGGIVGEKMSPKTLMLIALFALTLGMAGLAEARGYGLMLVYAVGMGIGFGLTFIASTMLLITYFGKKANLELYSIMSLMSTSAALGPAVGGWARDAFGGFVGLFMVCAATAAIMLVATWFMHRPTLQQDPQTSPLQGEAA